MGHNFFDDAIAAIRNYVEQEHGGNTSRASTALGMAGDTLHKWLNGTRSPKLEAIGPVLDRLGFTITTPTIRRVAPNAPVEVVQGDDLKTIQVYSSAGAGPGVAVENQVPLFAVTAPPSYFFCCDFAVAVDGHSMEPTIPHNAVVGVREFSTFKANELYIAAIPYEGMVVKRIAVDRERGEFIFKSDNPDKEAYPDYRQPIDSAEKIIMGRVVWVMRGY